jgi:hypothetical protein
MDKNSREARSSESAADNRVNREDIDRTLATVSDPEMSDEERIEIFRNTFVQASLPSLPKIPGWRVCWCSLTNPRDTIPLRMALGYVPVQPHEIKGWRGGNITTIESGEMAGWVSHNEMVAMKLPERLYDRYMQEAHHIGPANESEKLVRQAERFQEQARSSGAKVMASDGLESIKREISDAPVGSFQ